MQNLKNFKNLADKFSEQDEKMPALFVGHGSPMNALQDNEFTQGWRESVANLPKPKAVLCVSAHWETRGTWVTAMDKPKTIHDFGGFPKALFEVQYPAEGSKIWAEEIKNEIKSISVGLDETWGLDHGTWSVLKHLYPDAAIPVLQLSLDYSKSAEYHYHLAKELVGLRKKGILIIGSGNMVHNFQYARFGSNFNEHFGLDWALEANETFKKLISDQNHTALIRYQTFSKALALSAPTPEHYLPLLYTLALQDKNEDSHFFNDVVIGASFSMTSVSIG